jgi:hypothetical protein
MRLNDSKLNVDEKLAEFDQWLTPKLERIKESDKFNQEIESISKVIKVLGEHLQQFDIETKSIENLVSAVIVSSEKYITNTSYLEDEKEVSSFYESVFSLLFLVTGATDNNLKNHFLIKLKEDDIVAKIPKRGHGQRVKFSLSDIPTTTKSDDLAKSLAACFVASSSNYIANVTTVPAALNLFMYLEILLKEYISLILEDESDLAQLWVICASFLKLAEESEEKAKLLINSCTIFKIRGSVAATGGHIPEKIMRNKMCDIGLVANIDYNTVDVIVGEDQVAEKGKQKLKTRAYDFVLPYKVPQWEPKIFIQCQFYAGDSGSVSHKVIDQTTASRAFTSSKVHDARFIEYLDGAGYYASLRGDLTKMLALEDTHGFIQLKSILIRLRRELQDIRFLTPLEFEHAILRTTEGEPDKVERILLNEGYAEDEINRVKNDMLNRGLLTLVNGYLIAGSRKQYATMLFILDCAANNSTTISDADRKLGNHILVPGSGANFGIKVSELSEIFYESFNYYPLSNADFNRLIESLVEEGVATRK